MEVLTDIRIESSIERIADLSLLVQLWLPFKEKWDMVILNMNSLKWDLFMKMQFENQKFEIFNSATLSEQKLKFNLDALSFIQSLTWPYTLVFLDELIIMIESLLSSWYGNLIISKVFSFESNRSFLQSKASLNINSLDKYQGNYWWCSMKVDMHSIIECW